MGEPVPSGASFPLSAETSALRLPITVRHELAELQVRLLLDTGANATTLGSSALEALGLEPTLDAPRHRFMTPAGPMLMRPVRLDVLEVGDIRFRDVAVFLCHHCGTGADGILGANILDRVSITIDRRAGVLRLEPYDTATSTADVDPFVTHELVARPEGRMIVSKNTADIGMADLILRLTCSEDSVQLAIGALEAGAVVETRVPDDLPCREFGISIIDGTWS